MITQPIHSSARRRGFTLVELAVTVLLTALLIGLIWALFLSETTRLAVENIRLGSVSGAALLEQRLSRDLARIALTTPSYDQVGRSAPARYHLDRPVEIDQEGRRLSFLRFADEDPGRGAVPVQRVEYALQPGTGRILRSIGDKTEHLPGILAEDLRFALLSFHVQADRLHRSAPPPRFSANVRAQVISYRVTTASEELLATPIATRGRARGVTLVGGVSLSGRAERAQMPVWLATPDERLLTGAGSEVP